MRTRLWQPLLLVLLPSTVAECAVLCAPHLDDHVGVLLLWVDVGIEVGLACLDGLLDAVEAVATLSHVTLDLPCELDLVADVQVDLEVNQVTHTLVVEGVETLNHQDLHGWTGRRRDARAGTCQNVAWQLDGPPMRKGLVAAALSTANT